MDIKQRFIDATGSSFFLTAGQEPELSQYLKAHSWMDTNEVITNTEKPGEGNMNFVLRVQTNRRSFIIKQARPWVEKYPQLAAPIERIQTESQFYSLVQQNELLKTYTPSLVGTDVANYVLVLEDLGDGADFSYVYQKGQGFTGAELDNLITFLQSLHHTAFASEAKESFPKNQALKELNHEHIFDFPYRSDNGMDLDGIQPGLRSLAEPIYADDSLRQKISQLGELYLGEGNHLIHGDFYPGSWLKVNGTVKVIDPEFSYFGLAEFDVAVFLAHLKMAQSSPALQQKVREQYQAPSDFDETLLDQFIGVEILRRLIGIAQLPLALTIDEKGQLMQEAISLLKQ